ncbi:MAG TPA: AAA family ATPase [Actinomycetota bacterium]|nr:AAA family ATPase [Actinomycetota bacterium]
MTKLIPAHAESPSRRKREVAAPLGNPRSDRKLSALFIEVVLVAGPPCSGKSTYVRDHARPGDLVLDWDRLNEAVSLEPNGDPRNRSLSWYANTLFDAALAKLENDPEKIEKAWVVSCAPTPESRRKFEHRFNATVVVMETTKAECQKRLPADRPYRRALQLAIEAWR